MREPEGLGPTPRGLRRRLHRATAGAHRGQIFGWGFASQLSSSITSFGLSLLAARAVGPSGLGAVSVGFACFLLVQSMQRALLLEPMSTSTARLALLDRRRATRHAFTVVLIGGVAAVLVMAGVGELLHGELRHGIHLFLPWAIPCLVQDFCRAVLFRDGDGAGAALIDLTWLVVVAALAPLAVLSHSSGGVVACWGAGGSLAAIIGLSRSRIVVAPVRDSLRWWRDDAWPIGRWLGSNTVVYALASQGFVFLVGGVIGAEALGGLRAAETLFAPLSLMAPALALPGLPAIARRLDESWSAGRALAIRLGLAATLLTCVYMAAAVVLRHGLLARIFGPEFTRFDNLVWPFGLGQLAIAPTVGLTLFLIAQRRGRPLLLSVLLKAGALVVPGLLLVTRYGVTGAAWAMTAGWLAQHAVIAAAGLTQAGLAGVGKCDD